MTRAFTTTSEAQHESQLFCLPSAVGAKARRAFTLVETVVVIAITALILVTLGVLLSYFYKTNKYTLEQAVQVEQARRGVEDALRYLREASYGSDGSYPIKTAATSTITFYTNVDSDQVIERVTYALISGTFYRVVTQPAGNPPAYTGAISTSTLSMPVVNSTSTPVFHYFDDTGAELPTPANIAQIASVQTTLVVDANINRAPISFTLSGGATLRNLRDQL
jgi:type II secretory pathway pseudopilin PulG